MPERILVIRLSALGDVLFTMPAVEALRRSQPQARIDWLVEDRAAALLDLYPGLHRRLVYPRARLAPLWQRGRLLRAGGEITRHLAALRQEHYDLVLDFQGNLKSGVHRALARGRTRVGFGAAHAREMSHLFPGRSVTPGPQVVHRIDQALALVRGVLPDVPAEPPRPPLRVPAANCAFIDAALAGCGLAHAEPFVILHPGTSAFGAFKRWAPDRFAHLGDRLGKELGVRCLVSFGPGEESLARQVLESGKRGTMLLAPATRSLPDLAALLERARLLVGSDSAPLHLAAFLQTPVVALFGPKDPRIYGPRFAAHEIAHTYLHCSPCARRRCPDVLCMAEIGVDQVLAAARRLLKLREAG